MTKVVRISKPRVCTREACESCREKKAKCDGEQPCSRCEAREIDCHYRSRARRTKRSLRLEIDELREKQRRQDALISTLRKTSASEQDGIKERPGNPVLPHSLGPDGGQAVVDDCDGDGDGDDTESPASRSGSAGSFSNSPYSSFPIDAGPGSAVSSVAGSGYRDDPSVPTMPDVDPSRFQVGSTQGSPEVWKDCNGETQMRSPQVDDAGVGSAMFSCLDPALANTITTGLDALAAGFGRPYETTSQGFPDAMQQNKQPGDLSVNPALLEDSAVGLDLGRGQGQYQNQGQAQYQGQGSQPDVTVVSSAAFSRGSNSQFGSVPEWIPSQQQQQQMAPWSTDWHMPDPMYQAASSLPVGLYMPLSPSNQPNTTSTHDNTVPVPVPVSVSASVPYPSTAASPVYSDNRPSRSSSLNLGVDGGTRDKRHESHSRSPSQPRQDGDPGQTKPRPSSRKWQNWHQQQRLNKSQKLQHPQGRDNVPGLEQPRRHSQSRRDSKTLAGHSAADIRTANQRAAARAAALQAHQALMENLGKDDRDTLYSQLHCSK